MEALTDVFEFATTHTDYWEDFLTGSGNPDELESLNDRELEALEAARTHIENALVALLHAAASKVFEAKHNPPIRKSKPRASATLKNQAVYLHCPKGRGADMYRLGFCLDADESGSKIKLYPFLTLKKRTLEDSLVKLRKKKVKFAHHDYDVYGEGVELMAGAEVNELASRAAKQLFELIEKSR